MTRILGSRDQEVAVPSAMLPLGRQDAAALQAILDFLKVAGDGTWSGLQATGTVTSPNSQIGNPATLMIQGGDDFRLDVIAPEGQRSIRIHGARGQILESDGKHHMLPVATATCGLLAFPKIFAPAFPAAGTSVIDQGMLTVEGNVLHRITIETSVTGSPIVTSSSEISVTDLYFDPSTHLLAKSVGAVQVDPADRERYVQTISYGTYKKVSGFMLPFTYRQTLNGQTQWILQLSDIQLNPAASPSYFEF